MTFDKLNLSEPILKAITACGYTKPTDVQAQAIPAALANKDLIVSAPTGTGKTASFTLPALHRLSLTKSAGKARILILTPTRELARQITQSADLYGKFLKLNIVSLVGGMPYHQQLKSLSRPVDIIVATPGRLLDHMRSKRLDLSGVEMLILDEADRMLDMGFIDDVKEIAKMSPKNRQTLLFSATVNSRLAGIAGQLLKDPVRIDAVNEKTAPPDIKQHLYLSDNPAHKTQLFEHLLESENIFKAIIFSATKINADKLANDLREQGYSAAALHGDLKQSMRNRTLQDLERGRIQFLVATDVASRGIDISDISHVINYDVPKFSEDYVHRIGRTGRAGRSGVAISLALPSDARHIQGIERYTGQRLQLATVAGLEPRKNVRVHPAANPAGKKRSFSKPSSFSKPKSGNNASNANSRFKPRRSAGAGAAAASGAPARSHANSNGNGNRNANRSQARTRSRD